MKLNASENSARPAEGAARFREEVYAFLRTIPAGRVVTYGQIAALLGNRGHARRVGRALRTAPDDTPCHRVVNAAGRLAPHFPGQRALLEAEGVPFKQNGHVDLARCRRGADSEKDGGTEQKKRRGT